MSDTAGVGGEGMVWTGGREAAVIIPADQARASPRRYRLIGDAHGVGGVTQQHGCRWVTATHRHWSTGDVESSP